MNIETYVIFCAFNKPLCLGTKVGKSNRNSKENIKLKSSAISPLISLQTIVTDIFCQWFCSALVNTNRLYRALQSILQLTFFTDQDLYFLCFYWCTYYHSMFLDNCMVFLLIYISEYLLWLTGNEPD